MLVLQLLCEKLPLLRNQSTFQCLEQRVWKDMGCNTALRGTCRLARVGPGTEECIL